MEHGESKMLVAAATGLALSPPDTTAAASVCVWTQPPQEKREFVAMSPAMNAQVSVGPTPVVLWKKKTNRYNKEVEKLKVEAPSRTGLKEPHPVIRVFT